MRHNLSGRLFGRTANQRKALLRGLVGSLIEHERVETTVAKAKEARVIAEKLITLGIRGDLHAKRLVMSRLPNRSLVVKLFHEIAPRFSGRNGGYLRVVRTRRRVNDRAEMAVLEFVDYEEIRGAAQGEKKAEKAKKEKKATAEKKAGKKAEKKAKAPAETEKKKAAAPKRKKSAAAGEEKAGRKKTAASAGEGKKAKAEKPAKKKTGPAKGGKAAAKPKKGSTGA